jgi:hypothetical protein
MGSVPHGINRKGHRHGMVGQGAGGLSGFAGAVSGRRFFLASVAHAEDSKQSK